MLLQRDADHGACIVQFLVSVETSRGNLPATWSRSCVLSWMMRQTPTAFCPPCHCFRTWPRPSSAVCRSHPGSMQPTPICSVHSLCHRFCGALASVDGVGPFDTISRIAKLLGLPHNVCLSQMNLDVPAQVVSPYCRLRRRHHRQTQRNHSLRVRLSFDGSVLPSQCSAPLWRISQACRSPG